MKSKEKLKPSSVLGLTVLVYIVGNLIATMVGGIIGSYIGEAAVNYTLIILALVVIPLVYRLLRDGELWNFRKCSWNDAGKYIAIGLLISIAIGYILSYAIVVFELQNNDNIEQFYQMSTHYIEGNIFILFIATAVAPAICEELVFRGALFGVIRTKKGFCFAAIVSSLIFGVLHGSAIYLIVTFIIGMILCMVYEVTRSIIVPIAIHLCNNFLASVESIIIESRGEELFIFDNMNMNVVMLLALTAISIIGFVILTVKIKRAAAGKDTFKISEENHVEPADN